MSNGSLPAMTFDGTVDRVTIVTGPLTCPYCNTPTMQGTKVNHAEDPDEWEFSCSGCGANNVLDTDPDYIQWDIPVDDISKLSFDHRAQALFDYAIEYTAATSPFNDDSDEWTIETANDNDFDAVVSGLNELEAADLSEAQYVLRGARLILSHAGFEPDAIDELPSDLALSMARVTGTMLQLRHIGNRINPYIQLSPVVWRLRDTPAFDPETDHAETTESGNVDPVADDRGDADPGTNGIGTDGTEPA